MWCRYQLDTVKQCRVCGLIFFAEHNPIFLHLFLLSQLLVFKRLACNSSCLMLETIAYLFRPFIPGPIQHDDAYSSGISTAAHVGRFMGCNSGLERHFLVAGEMRRQDPKIGNLGWNPKRWGVKYGKVYWIYFTPIFYPQQLSCFGHFLIHCFQLNDLSVECSKRFTAIFGDLVTWKVCWWRGAVPVSNGDTGKCTLLGGMEEIWKCMYNGFVEFKFSLQTTSLSTTHTQLCDKKRHNPNGSYSTRCHRSACRCLFATAVCMRDSEPPGLQKKSNAVLLGKPLTMSSSSEADSPNVYCYKLSMYTGSLQHSKVFSEMCCLIKRASAYSFKEDKIKLRNTSDPRLGVIHHSLCCLHIQLSK